jgi:hypothetical protein
MIQPNLIKFLKRSFQKCDLIMNRLTYLTCSLVGIDTQITIISISLAGVISHSVDYKKSAGGFIHGFRYTGIVWLS